MALTSLNASTNALANYTSLTSNTTGSGVKDNSSKTQESQTNTSGAKPASSSPTTKVKEAQSPAVTKSISADAWNYSSTPSTGSSPSTYAPAYDAGTGQPLGRESEKQSTASPPPSSPPPPPTTPNASTNALAAYTSLMATVFEGAKNGLSVRQPNRAADPGQQRASRDAIAAYSGQTSLSSVVNLADYFAAPKEADRVVLVAANDSKWPSNGGPVGDPPDVRLRQVQGAKPVSLDLPEGSVRDIGTLDAFGFIGAATIVARSNAAAKPQDSGQKSQVSVNRDVGNAFRDEIADALRGGGLSVQTEISKSTPFGRRVIDIEVSNGSTVLGGIETKAGDSRYRPAQRSKDNWLRLDQGYVVSVVRDK